MPLLSLEENKLQTDGERGALSDSTLLAGVLAFTAVLYAATIRFQFVYDDQGYIVENVLVHSWRFVPMYFQGHVWQYLFPGAPANYYRPLNLLWTRCNDALFGLHPAGWHVLAIALHLCATALVFFVARRLTGRPLVAAFTALLFGVHPVHHEVVAWVSGTTESVWSVFFFLSFLAYLKSRESHRARWLAASCALYAAALLAKEPAIVLPALVCAHAWFYGDESQEEGALQQSFRARALRLLWLGSIYVPVAIVYLAVRVHVLHGFSHPQVSVPTRVLLLTIPSVLFFYVKQWLLPIRFAEFYPLPLAMRFDVAHVLLPFLGLLVVGGALWLARKTLGKREVGFAIAWMFLTLLPALDVAVFPPGQLVHDRYFYLPSFGAALLVALAVNKLAYGPVTFGLPRAMLLFTLCVVGVLSYSAATASSYWLNDYVLFDHARKIAPDNLTVRNNYAVEVAYRGDIPAALPLLNALLTEYPNNYLANYNFAWLSYQIGNFAAAEQYFERAQRIDPSLPDPYLLLGMIALKSNHRDAAEMDMRRAVAIRPMEPTFHFALGVTLAQKGDCDGARSEFSEALVLKPDFLKAREQLGKCHPQAAQIEPAESYKELTSSSQ
jgi:protein O-mannosyl-transferase